MSGRGTTTDGAEALCGPIRRFDAVAGAIIWWACHLAASYWLVPRACTWGTHWPIHLVTLILLALTGRSWLSGRQLLHGGRAARDEPPAERDVYLGWTGMAFAVFFGAVIIAEWIPTLFLDPCW